MEPPQRWLRAWALFFDCVHSLVPAESRGRISRELQEFASVNPGVYESLEPPPGSSFVPDIDLARFDRNLQLIAETRKDPGKIEIEIKDLTVRIRNHTFLHNVKLSGSIKQLLRKHKLLVPNLGDAYMSGYEVVQEDAADVILSYLCKRAAKERGWSTLTDCELPFAVIASEDLRPTSRAVVQPGT